MSVETRPSVVGSEVPVAAVAARVSAPEPMPAGPVPWVAVAAGAVGLLAALVLGFFVYFVGVSAAQEAHDQSILFDRMRSELNSATAPVSPQRDGTPVALLDVPAMGLHHLVVVQGTSGTDLMSGPGLRADTPLPGEQGVSVLYGRRSSFGGPFGRLGSLRVGDTITVTTGHGVSHYRVTKFSSDGQPVRDTAPNRLVLVTAGPGLTPEYARTASAVLVGTPLPDDGGYPGVGARGAEMASDSAGIGRVLLWSVLLVIVAAGGTAAAVLWSRWPAWLLATPITIAVVWNIYENAAPLLPNLL